MHYEAERHEIPKQNFMPFSSSFTLTLFYLIECMLSVFERIFEINIFPFLGSGTASILSYSSFASSEVNEVKGVIAPYGRRGVKTIVFLS